MQQQPEKAPKTLLVLLEIMLLLLPVLEFTSLPVLSDNSQIDRKTGNIIHTVCLLGGRGTIG